MNRRFVEEKARQIATNMFSDGIMRTILYERIVSAFGGDVTRTSPPVICTRCSGAHPTMDCRDES